MTDRPKPPSFGQERLTDPTEVRKYAPEWNDVRVKAVGEKIEGKINGATSWVVEDRDPANASKSGPVVLQFRPTDRYRLEIRDIAWRPVPEQN